MCRILPFLFVLGLILMLVGNLKSETFPQSPNDDNEKLSNPFLSSHDNLITGENKNGNLEELNIFQSSRLTAGSPFADPAPANTVDFFNEKKGAENGMRKDIQPFLSEVRPTQKISDDETYLEGKKPLDAPKSNFNLADNSDDDDDGFFATDHDNENFGNDNNDDEEEDDWYHPGNTKDDDNDEDGDDDSEDDGNDNGLKTNNGDESAERRFYTDTDAEDKDDLSDDIGDDFWSNLEHKGQDNSQDDIDIFNNENDRKEDDYYRGHLLDNLNDNEEMMKKNKPPTAPTNMVLFYTWMIVAILIMVIVVSTYQTKCKGASHSNGIRQPQRGEDRKRLLDNEFV